MPPLQAVLLAVGAAIAVCIGAAIGWLAARRREPQSRPVFHVPDARPQQRGASPVDSGEWRRVAAALKQTEEKHRILVEHSDEGIFVAQDGVIKFPNPKAIKMLGYSADELARTPLADVIGPEDRAMVVERYQRRLRGEEVPSQYQFRFLRRSGETLWVDMNAVRVDWEGKPASLCFVRDIDAQRQTAAALRETEALHQSLIESLPLSVFRKDRGGKLVHGNRRFCQTVGLAPEELVGKTDQDLYPPHLAEKYRRDDEAVMTSGENLEDIEEYRKSDGTMAYVQVLKAPVRDASGTIVGVQGMFWDVTERERAEEQLRQNAERIRLILDTALDAYMAIDENGQIIDWNRQAEKTFGWTKAEAVGRNVAATVLPDVLRDLYGKRLHEFLERGAGTMLNRRLEIRALHRDGHEFPVEIAITPMRVDGALVLNAFLHDITRRKQAQQELMQAKEAAEAASRAKSAFLANMSHEIRTPMNAIIGMAELVLDTDLNSEQREYLKLVLESADALLSIINDLLDFSKIEAGKYTLDLAPFDLYESVGDTIKSLAVRAHNKGLELVHDIRPETPVAVVGDAGRLRQVVINLVGNAIKFTDRGEVVLTVSQYGEPHGAAGDDADNGAFTLHFAVRDTGIGIPADKQELVFRAFEQADTSTTRRFGGTGLGLAISARLVELMGGRIWVESAPGSGSTFHFTAVFHEAENGAPWAAPAVRASLHGLRVLVVDDNATNRRILREILTNWGMRPEEAATADDGYQQLLAAGAGAAPFQLVLTDAHMPDVDGFQLVERIRNNRELDGAVVMMLSSGDRPEDVAHCRELGIAQYLTKPVKQSELFDAIAATLGADAGEEESTAEAAPATPPLPALKVLVAEDSLVNQKLAVGLLTRHGHTVSIANNGREAVAAAAAGRFDLILMDVQMPEMDGLEATAAIRAAEVRMSRRTPIVAMTAHALKGDRERCLEAGMDDYLSKPIRSRDLFATIGRALRLPEDGAIAATEDPGADAQGASSAPSPGVVWDAALAAVRGDRALLAEIAEACLIEAPRLVDGIRAAVAAGNAADLHHDAHTLKGTVRCFGAERAYELASQLEVMGKRGDLAGADAALALLESEVAAIVAALRNPPKPN